MTPKNRKRIVAYMHRLDIPIGMAKGFVACDRAAQCNRAGGRHLRRRSKHGREAQRLCARVFCSLDKSEL
ncbi:hypothetical protein [Prosthecobacter dejongeii]|uniref:Uncharacterized protein n=1 Tax=Prosthecobacter dejongeii TaxID=48465 RepID=A0A7W7YJQ9_9BACT|nr:hypothetical protein [Prosthecobacter dejongeii]MBB5037140.1 hypothetical protein [Prosthecobacter dejongeii]